MKRENQKSAVSYQQVINKAMEVFGYNKDKALAWYISKQEGLSNMSPFEICRNGNGRAVIKILERTLITK